MILIIVSKYMSMSDDDENMKTHSKLSKSGDKSSWYSYLNIVLVSRLNFTLVVERYMG